MRVAFVFSPEKTVCIEKSLLAFLSTRDASKMDAVTSSKRMPNTTGLFQMIKANDYLKEYAVDRIVGREDKFFLE